MSIFFNGGQLSVKNKKKQTFLQTLMEGFSAQDIRLFSTSLQPTFKTICEQLNLKTKKTCSYEGTAKSELPFSTNVP